ncbi:hypothetical protein ACWYXD_10800 [Enterobacter roggenkampii]
MSEAKRQICLLCKNQANAGRKDPPHKNLVKTGALEMNARGKDASERYYTCSECGCEWVWEPGNYGQGWI